MVNFPLGNGWNNRLSSGCGRFRNPHRMSQSPSLVPIVDKPDCKGRSKCPPSPSLIKHNVQNMNTLNLQEGSWVVATLCTKGSLKMSHLQEFL